MEQFLSARYLSGRTANQKIGVVGFTTDKSLEVIGLVGIGSTIFDPVATFDVRGSANIRDTLTVGSGTLLSNTTISQLRVTGVSTLGVTSATNLTAQQLNISGIGTIPTLGGTTATYNTGNFTLGNIVTGIVTNISGTNLNYTGISTLGVTTITRLTTQSINSSGIITGSTFRPSTGYIQAADGTNSLYIYNSTGNVAFQGTIGASQINNSTGNKVIGFAGTNITFESDARVGNNAYISGITTSIGGFVGDLTGTATTATKLQFARNFSITGNFVTASAIAFDGTSNVSLAATVLPDSIGLGTYTYGDYVKNISGTSNQITVTGGTGEGSVPVLSIPSQFTAPQDVTVSRDLQVGRNLNVNGNITIAGTTAFINVQELKIYDTDLVLGVRTDGNGNDISTDNTANHGGLSIASTEGNPLIQIYNPGIGESTPATYKKIMWFKAGTFAGMGTDAWLFNYAVGIGSTQFPSGTRLAVGNVQFNQNDLSVVRNINASGIVTANSLSIGSVQVISPGRQLQNILSFDNVTSASIDSVVFIDLQVTGVSTFTNGPVLIGSGTSTGTTGQILQVAGINSSVYVGGNIGVGTTTPSSKFTVIGDALVTGILTSTRVSTARLSPDGSNFGVNSYIPVADGTGTWSWQPVTTAGAGILNGIVVREEGVVVGTAGSVTTLDFRGNNITAVSVTGGAIATITASDTPSFLSLTVTPGISTLGVTTITSLTAQQLSVSGVSTFTSGPLLIGGGASTGTSSQPLQVTGGAVFTGTGSSVGIGTTNPTRRVHIVGDASTNRFNASVSVMNTNATGFGAYYGLNVSSLTNGRDFRLVSNGTSDTAGVGNFSILDATANIDRFVITGIGSVGIGTTTPSSTLTVVGSGAFTGIVTASGANFTNLNASGISTIGNFRTTPVGSGATVGGIGVTYYGDGSQLSNVLTVVPVTVNTTNQSQYLTYSPSIGSTTGLGVTATSLVFNPSTTRLGIGTTNPVATLQVRDTLSFDTTTTTTTSTSQIAVDTFGITTFRSVKYQVQITCPGQIATIGGITTGGRGYTAGTFNIGFTTTSGIGTGAQGTLVISNGTVNQLSIASSGTGYAAGDVLSASGGTGLQVSVGSTDPSTGAILTLGSITNVGSGYNAGVGVGTTVISFTAGSGSGATGLATIFDGVITSASLLQQPTTGTGGAVYYSGSNYTTSSVLSVDRTALTNIITTITGDPIAGVSTLTSFTAHGLNVNDIIRASSTSSTLQLSANTDYYVLTIPSTTTFTVGTGVGVGTYVGFNTTVSNVTGTIGITSTTITGITTTSIAVGQYVKPITNIISAGTTVTAIGVGSVFINPASINVGSSTTTFDFGSYSFTSQSFGFYRNSAIAGGAVTFTNSISGVSTNYQVSELLVLQNGTVADYIEYGTIANNDILGTFASDISGSNARLLFTPTYSTNTIKIARQGMTL